MRAAAVGLLCLLGACTAFRAGLPAGGGTVGAAPLVAEDGDRLALATRLCRPPGPGPFPLAVIAHAGAPTEAGRAATALPSCDNPAARFFLARNYVVAMPLRRGYGETGGDWAANPGACAAPDDIAAGTAGARDLEAAIGWATSLPGVRPDGIVLMGEGEGGWAALGYVATGDPRLAAVVVVAAGLGGRAAGLTGHTCRPDLLVDAAARFGQTARVPSLWVYPRGDPDFGGQLPDALRSGFAAGGSPARLATPDGAAPQSGGWLADPRGGTVWEPLAAGFLDEVTRSPPAGRGARS